MRGFFLNLFDGLGVVSGSSTFGAGVVVVVVVDVVGLVVEVVVDDDADDIEVADDGGIGVVVSNGYLRSRRRVKGLAGLKGFFGSLVHRRGGLGVVEENVGVVVTVGTVVAISGMREVWFWFFNFPIVGGLSLHF